MPAKLVPGILVDRYQVEENIGAGSMGDVVRALDIDLHRPVAIKILSEKHRENDELRARFMREGRAVASISHANVVQVFTTGSFDDRPYIAMELLRGTDLGTYVRDRGPMPSLHATRAILDAARGLEAAASAGLIHRDVKPSNLVMLDNGVVKVTDFGLAKPLDPKNEPALTAMGVVVGTPDYIAPEQARGEAIDEHVDIYALGGTLYFLLTGKPPFRKGNPNDDKYLKVVARHLKEPAPNPLIEAPDTHRDLAALQMRMMAKKPQDRPSYRTLVSELAAIVESLQNRRTEAIPSASGKAVSSAAPAEPTPFLGGKRRLEHLPAIAPQHGVSDEDLTLVRAPSVGHELESSAAMATARRSGWLVATTGLSALIFAVGLGLYLFGPVPGGAKSLAVVAIDAAPPPSAPPDAAPPPEPPQGFLLVRTADHAFFIAKAPTSYGDYSSVFPTQKKPITNKKRSAAPVSSVSFAYAHAYAKSKNGRLPSPEEWQAASEQPGFVTGIKWEWADDGTEGTQAQQPLMSIGEAMSRRRPRAYPDVGFRIVVEVDGKGVPPSP